MQLLSLEPHPCHWLESVHLLARQKKLLEAATVSGIAFIWEYRTAEL